MWLPSIILAPTPTPWVSSSAHSILRSRTELLVLHVPPELMKKSACLPNICERFGGREEVGRRLSKLLPALFPGSGLQPYLIEPTWDLGSS